MHIILAIYAASTLVSMAIMSIGTGLVLLGLVRWGIRGGENTSFARWRSYAEWSGLLALACILSLVFARWHPIEGLDPAAVRWGKDLFKLWYFLWPPVLAALLFRLTDAQQGRILKIWLAVFGVVSLIGIQQFWTGWPRMQSIPNLPGHFHSTLFLGHHLSVASIWIFPFFMALSAALSPERGGLADQLGISRRVLLGLVAVGGLTLFLGFSRMLWLGLPVGVLALVFLKADPQWRLRYTLLSGLGTGAACVALFQLPMIRERLLHSMGTTERFDLWLANLELFRLRPFTGAGWHHNLDLAGQVLRRWHFGQDVFVSHAHNNVLEVLGGTGLLGIVGWLGWNIWLARSLWRQSQVSSAMAGWRRELAQGSLAALVVFHLNGLTQVNFWEGKVQHQLSWMVAWSLLALLHEGAREKHS
jgi:O-antigen ligase